MARHEAQLVDGTTRTNQSLAPVNLGGLVAVKIAATTLTAADHGCVCEWNTAAGYAFTLPAVERGLRFRFVVRTTITSLAARVACATGDFFLGDIVQSTDGTFVTATHTANGTTHLAFSANGSTTGGIKGDWFDIVGYDDTRWLVCGGLISATGSEASPWATS